jgi:hypothetical protein
MFGHSVVQNKADGMSVIEYHPNDLKNTQGFF